MRKRLGRSGPFGPIVTRAAGSRCKELEMAQHKGGHTDELADRIAEADRIASQPRPQRGEYLHATIREGDDEAQAKEKALAERIAAHPEDAGRAVKDFKWIVHEIVSPLRNPILAAALAWDERRKTGNGSGKLH